jgi:IS605 OrfB family transposase
MKGSKRRRKAVNLLAKANQKVRRQRRDFHHKVALTLVRQFDTIYYEDLQTANMVRNHQLAKSISDAGWSSFLTILAFTAACASKRVVAVPPAFTSRSRARSVQGRIVGVWVGRGCQSAGTPAQTVAPAYIATTTPPRTFLRWARRHMGLGRPFRRERSPLGQA